MLLFFGNAVNLRFVLGIDFVFVSALLEQHSPVNHAPKKIGFNHSSGEFAVQVPQKDTSYGS